MAKLLIEIDDKLLARVLSEAQLNELSVDAFINDALSSIQIKSNLLTDELISVNDILSRLIQRAKELKGGEEFTVMDICTIEDWKSISGGERKGLGRSFRQAVEKVNPQIAKLIGKTSSNKAIYVRV